MRPPRCRLIAEKKIGELRFSGGARRRQASLDIEVVA